MSSTDAISTDVQSQSQRMVGQVKWFNNKAGYGFITVSDGEFANKDIFIHFSSVLVVNSQYKYLVQGEYVEFNVMKSKNSAHEFQATDVSGIKGGPLMCETRNMARPVEDAPDRRAPRRHRLPREGGASESNDGFTVVRRNKQSGDRKFDLNAPLSK